ncbi:MAG TPA: Gfo/Idh/MocA family oxidoreductase [Candidatus Dormibacteraeota bacterium]|jgi:predicted dehydrogenase|nr:Gfo/Idh/MocA family oxidoreductase [Candidatus Dormibacteraeota bacterium]
MSFKVGIVGCGDIAGWNYLPGTHALAGTVDIVATCDAVADRARSAAAEFGAPGCRAYTSLDEVLADGEVEGVEVLTPWPLHFEMCLRVLESGRHVYVQKPMCQHLGDAERLLEAAVQRGVVLMAAPPSMVNPVTLRIASLVREGVLGKVAMVFCRSSHGGATGRGRLTDSRWFFMKEAGEWTSLFDMGVYGLHTVTGIIGPARRVSAFSGTAFPERTFFSPERPEPEPEHITADDNGMVLLDWGDGTLGCVDGSFTMIEPSTRGLTIYGSKGVITHAGFSTSFRLYQSEAGDRFPRGWCDVDGEGRLIDPEKLEVSSDGPGPRRVERGRAVSGRRRAPSPDIVHWADCVTRGTRPLLSAEHAAHVVEIMEKAIVASRTGNAQDLTTTFPDPVSRAGGEVKVA